MPTIEKYKKEEDRKRQAYQHFIGKGYSPEASAGIVGNLVYESGLDTSIEGDKGFRGGSSFGIAQFRGERLKRLKSMYGDKWTDLNNQLNFVDWELKNTHKKAGDLLRTVSDVHKAGQIFSDFYEIPAKKYNENKDRANKVEQVYQTLVVTPNNNPTEVKIAQEYIPTTQSTTTVTNLTKPTENVNFTAEINKLEQQAKDKELAFLQEYQNTLTTPQEQMAQEEIAVQAPQMNITDIFNQVSQFIDTPIVAQQGAQIYNPSLSKNTDFKNWYNQNTIEGQNNIPYTENLDYDYLSFFMSGDYKNPEYNIDNHFPDTYKRPNHETFSNESLYSVPENTGGRWAGDIFISSKQQGGMKDNEMAFLSDFKKIPVSSKGMYEYPNQPVIVPTDGSITMKNITHKIKGKSLETGEEKTMIPGMEYFFKDTHNVLEVPWMQAGGMRALPTTEELYTKMALNSAKIKGNDKVPQKAIKMYLDEGSKEYKDYKERDSYYNPPKKDISSGDQMVDFIYNNEWLLDAPIVGEILKNKAKSVVANSKGNPVIGKPSVIGRGSYGGNFNNEGNSPKLLDQYFSKKPILNKAIYKPTSDYLEFLPTYSVKGDFEKKISDEKEMENFKDLIEREFFYKKDYNKFLKDKKTVFSPQTEMSDFSVMLDADLGGHKLGASWDKEVGLPYLSIADAWDFEPKHYSDKWGKERKKEDKAYVQSYLMHKAGNPYKIYDRFYFNPKTKEYISDEEIRKLKSKKDAR